MIYDVLYIDPPWEYRNKKTGGSHTSGAEQQYPTLSLDELIQLPVSSIAAKDSVCFLWATTPLGDEPYRLLNAWGFAFKTKWYWHKTGRKGTGYWTRGEVEEVLIGVRGKVPAWRSDLGNWIDAVEEAPLLSVETGRHSQKPDRVRNMIQVLTPDTEGRPTRRVELFAREAWWEGWDAYGLDIDPTHDVRSPDFWKMITTKEVMTDGTTRTSQP